MNSISRPRTSFIWYFFYALLLVDSINGFFLGVGVSVPIGQIYKTILLLFLLAYAVKTQSGAISCLCFLFYLPVFLIHGTLYPQGVKLLDSLGLMSKFLLPLWGFFAISRIVKMNPETGYRQIWKIFRINSIVLIANILLGLMGFGFSSYGDGGDDATGTRGFFYAINEVSGVFLILFGSILFYAKFAFTNKKYLLTLVFLLFCVVSFSTKTAMGGVLFIFIYLQYNFGKKRNMLKMTLVLLLLLPLIIYGGYRMALESGLWDRWTYFYNLSDNWYSFLLSGRDSYWEDNMSGKFYNADWLGQLVGLGAFLTVEMDPFDALLNFGYIGMIAVYGFWFYMISCAYKRRNKCVLAKFVMFVDILIVSLSVFAGHLMFSGLLGPFVPLFNSLMYVPDKVFYKNIALKK